MIYVTQGHEKSIGLEVFFKSCVLLSQKSLNDVILIVHRQTLLDYLTTLNIPFDLNQNSLFLGHKKINCLFISSQKLPQSTQCLLLALECMHNNKDVSTPLMVTLPTSKDQLIYNKKLYLGHTEFLRAYLKNNNLSMVFRSPQQNILLITDHIPLKKVPQAITSQLIVKKTMSTLNGFTKYFNPINEVIFAGLNPHVGEGGLLGEEDKIIFKAIQKIQKMEMSTNLSQSVSSILGPFSGDTLHHYKKTRPNWQQLFVYLFHDQGLPVFKSHFRQLGINITFGAPFLRLSVDHGTAFSLYGKNQANFYGCLYTLKESLIVLDKLKKVNNRE